MQTEKTTLTPLSLAEPRPRGKCYQHQETSSYYEESSLTPPDTSPNRRPDSKSKVVESPSIFQLARDRLRRSFNKTEGVDRTENIITHRGRLETWAGGGDLVIRCVPRGWLPPPRFLP